MHIFFGLLKINGRCSNIFVKMQLKKLYVSISGYHIAEVGANLITQMAFTHLMASHL